MVESEYYDRVDYRNADSDGSLHGDSQRNEQWRHRKRHTYDHRRRCNSTTCDHERHDGERDRGKRVQLSNRGDEFANQLWSHEFAGMVESEHCDGVDYRNADSDGSLHGDSQRNEQWRHRKRHTYDHRRRCNSTTCDHERHDGERDSGKRVLLSDHGDKFTHELRCDEFAGMVESEHCDGVDYRNADSDGSLHGDSQRNEQWRRRKRHTYDHRRRCNSTTCDHERHDGERDRGKRVQLSNRGDEFANQLWSHGFAGMVESEHCDGVDYRDADSDGNLDGDAERDQQRGHRERHTHDHGCRRDGTTCDHERHNGERDSGKRVHVPDHGDEFANQLRRDGSAGMVESEYYDRIDYRDADGDGNRDGDTERDQQRGHRERDAHAYDRGGGAGDHERCNAE